MRLLLLLLLGCRSPEPAAAASAALCEPWRSIVAIPSRLELMSCSEAAFELSGPGDLLEACAFVQAEASRNGWQATPRAKPFEYVYRKDDDSFGLACVEIPGGVRITGAR